MTAPFFQIITKSLTISILALIKKQLQLLFDKGQVAQHSLTGPLSITSFNSLEDIPVEIEQHLDTTFLVAAVIVR